MNKLGCGHVNTTGIEHVIQQNGFIPWQYQCTQRGCGFFGTHCLYGTITTAPKCFEKCTDCGATIRYLCDIPSEKLGFGLI